MRQEMTGFLDGSSISWSKQSTSLQTDNHTNTSSLVCRVIFPMPNQQCQSTEGEITVTEN